MRVFVALELPEPVRTRLAALGGGIPGARWMPLENLHLTLRFVGEVEPRDFEEIGAELRLLQAPAFDLELLGVGHFGDKKRSRLLWAGVAPSPALVDLQMKVESVLTRVGVLPEGRKFHPHITLARLKNVRPEQLGPFLKTHSLFREAPFEVAEFALYSSHLSESGASYRIEESFPLQLAL